MRNLQNQAIDTHDKVKLLQYKSIDSEARSRRNNLVFRGLTEEVGEDSMAVLQTFLLNKLDLDPDTVYIQRAHRVGRHQPRRGKDPPKQRPIIAAFRDYRDVEMILDSASRLKGSGKGINRGLPKELLDARKPL